jgi:hypothetical protein
MFKKSVVVDYDQRSACVEVLGMSSKKEVCWKIEQRGGDCRIYIKPGNGQQLVNDIGMIRALFCNFPAR